MDKERFGEFIAKKRKTVEKTLRYMADELGITAPYLSDIEKSRRNPPEMLLLKKFAEVLKLSSEEKNKMFDLAGQDRNEVSPDLPEYIMETPIVRAALRLAKKTATEDDWKKFINDLDNKER